MRRSNRSLLAITIGALGGVWCLVIFMATDRFVPPLPCGGGMAFVLIAVVLSVLYLAVFGRALGRQAAETAALPVIFTVLYAAAAAAANTVLILIGRGGFNGLLLACNAVIIIAYLLLILYAERDSQRLAEQLARTEQKLSGPLGISAKLGQILGITEDGQIRAQLLKLKEAVDYSTNITTGATFESERLMARQLDELMELVARRADPSDIQDKIREAEAVWKTRGSAASGR